MFEIKECQHLELTEGDDIKCSSCGEVVEFDAPTEIWWLSFADHSRPEGEGFLGACLVRAETLVDAVKRSHLLGLNPGGEVLGMPVDPCHYDKLNGLEEFVEVLLTKDQIQTFDMLMEGRSEGSYCNHYVRLEYDDRIECSDCGAVLQIIEEDE